MRKTLFRAGTARRKFAEETRKSNRVVGIAMSSHVISADASIKVHRRMNAHQFRAKRASGKYVFTHITHRPSIKRRVEMKNTQFRKESRSAYRRIVIGAMISPGEQNVPSNVSIGVP